MGKSCSKNLTRFSLSFNGAKKFFQFFYCRESVQLWFWQAQNSCFWQKMSIFLIIVVWSYDCRKNLQEQNSSKPKTRKSLTCAVIQICSAHRCSVFQIRQPSFLHICPYTTGIDVYLTKTSSWLELGFDYLYFASDLFLRFSWKLSGLILAHKMQKVVIILSFWQNWSSETHYGDCFFNSVVACTLLIAAVLFLITCVVQ